MASMLATVKPVRASGGGLVIPGALHENKAVSLKLTGSVVRITRHKARRCTMHSLSYPFLCCCVCLRPAGLVMRFIHIDVV